MINHNKFMCSVGIAYRVAWESEGDIPRLTLIVEHLKQIIYETAYSLYQDLYEDNGLCKDLMRTVEGFYLDDSEDDFVYEPRINYGEVIAALDMFNYAYIYNLNNACPVCNVAQQTFVFTKGREGLDDKWCQTSLF